MAGHLTPANHWLDHQLHQRLASVFGGHRRTDPRMGKKARRFDHRVWQNGDMEEEECWRNFTPQFG
ncbi:hypothetical protein BJX65DRAFT_290930 [Aspergillus insuetus]